MKVHSRDGQRQRTPLFTREMRGSIAVLTFCDRVTDLLVDAAVAMVQEIANRPYGNRESIKLASVVSGESLDEYLLREEAVFKKSIARAKASGRT